MAFTVTPRVRRIAEAEWKLFEQVHNIGGRCIVSGQSRYLFYYAQQPADGVE